MQLGYYDLQRTIGSEDLPLWHNLHVRGTSRTSQSSHRLLSLRALAMTFFFLYWQEKIYIIHWRSTPRGRMTTQF